MGVKAFNFEQLMNVLNFLNTTYEEDFKSNAETENVDKKDEVYL